MSLKSLAILFLISIAPGISTLTYAADETPIYGSQLMTEQERTEHRQRMRNATNEQEREQIRLQHHEQMKVRAKEQGVELPDEPPMRGGAGKGQGMGQGMGQGTGKGNR